MLRISGCSTTAVLITAAVSCAAAAWSVQFYMQHPAYPILGAGLLISRPAGLLINMATLCTLLLMARDVMRYAALVSTSATIRAIRSVWCCGSRRSPRCCSTARWCVDWSEHKALHMALGISSVVLGLIHSAGHWHNFWVLAQAADAVAAQTNSTAMVATLPLDDAYGHRLQFPRRVELGLFATLPGLTGHALLLVAAGFVWTARKAHRAAHYDRFWWAHITLTVLWTVLLCVHGSAGWLAKPTSWAWLAGPAITCAWTGSRRCWPRVFGWRTRVAAGGVRPGKIVRLEMARPVQRRCCAQWLQPMTWCAGEWIFFRVPHMRRWQWHAFTICSASESQRLSLSIKPAGGFTCALLKVVRAAVGGDISESALAAAMQQAAQRILLSDIAEDSVAAADGALKGKHRADLAPAQHVSGNYDDVDLADIRRISVAQAPDRLKTAFPMVQVDGPYTSPMAVALRQETHAMLIGAGIGGTPLSALLAGITATAHSVSASVGATAASRMPYRRVTMVWVCRHAAQFEPLWDELQVAADEAANPKSPLADVVDMQLYASAGLPPGVGTQASSASLGRGKRRLSTWVSPLAVAERLMHNSITNPLHARANRARAAVGRASSPPELPPEAHTGEDEQYLGDADSDAGSGDELHDIAAPSRGMTLKGNALSKQRRTSTAATSSALLSCLRAGRPDWLALACLHVGKGMADLAAEAWCWAPTSQAAPVTVLVPGRAPLCLANTCFQPSTVTGLSPGLAACAVAKSTLDMLLASMPSTSKVHWSPNADAGASGTIAEESGSSVEPARTGGHWVLLPWQHAVPVSRIAALLAATWDADACVRAGMYLCGPASIGRMLAGAAAECSGVWLAFWSDDSVEDGALVQGVQFRVEVSTYEEPFY